MAADSLVLPSRGSQPRARRGHQSGTGRSVTPQKATGSWGRRHAGQQTPLPLSVHGAGSLQSPALSQPCYKPERNPIL